MLPPQELTRACLLKSYFCQNQPFMEIAFRCFAALVRDPKGKWQAIDQFLKHGWLLIQTARSMKIPQTSKQQPGGFNQHGVSWETSSDWLHNECFYLFCTRTPNLVSFSISVSLHILDMRSVLCKMASLRNFRELTSQTALTWRGQNTKRSKKWGCLRQHVSLHTSAAG